MRVRVLLFAGLREAAGMRELQLDLADGSTAGAVVEALRPRLVAVAAILCRSALAINEEYAAASVPLHDGDTVAVIPPVSGG